MSTKTIIFHVTNFFSNFVFYYFYFCFDVKSAGNRAGPRHVGAPGRLITWCTGKANNLAPNKTDII